MNKEAKIMFSSEAKEVYDFLSNKPYKKRTNDFKSN